MERIQMAFERVQVNEDDFYTSLLKRPQKVQITDIGKLYGSDDKENQAYFYITFMLCDSNQKQQVSYNVGYVDEKIVVPEGAKLYPLVSYVSNIHDGEIHCLKEDIDDSLQDLKFLAGAQKQKGKKTWYKITPIMNVKGGEELFI